MTDTEKAKAYDEAVAYAKRVLDGLAEDYRCTHMTKDDIINQYSRLFPNEEAFQDDEDSFACRKLIYGLKSLIQQGKETFAGADITDLIDYLEKKQKPFKEPIDGVLYAAACGIKNKEQVEKSEKPMNQDEVLNEEIKKEMAKLPFCIRGKDLIAYARHFAKWGAEHAKEELMKEAVEWLDDNAWEFAITKSKANYEEFVRYDSRGLLEAFKKAIIKEDKQ